MKNTINVPPSLLAALTISFISIAVVTPARAQSPARTDPRWIPYLGCWHLVTDNVRNQGIEALIRSAEQSAATPRMTVCVQPSAISTGVTMTTFAETNKVLDQTIVADGTGRNVSESGCNGTQNSDWSRDGLRLFTRAELACSNRPKQIVSGLTLLTKGPSWVDIQAVESDGDHEVRIRRYTRAFDLPQGAAALPADLAAQAASAALDASTRAFSQDDVTEASKKVASQAVEAAIVETESRFNLNSRALLQLADAGVSPNVIDLMVAQSFPSHFRVEKPAYAPLPPMISTLPPSVVVTGGISSYPYGYGFYDPYSYYGLYYSPFAYPYYWGNSYYVTPRYYINNGSNLYVNGIGGGSPIGVPSPAVRGQVVNGQGYTRVHSGSGGDAGSGAQPSSHPVTMTPKAVRGAGEASSGSPSASTPSSSSGSAGGSTDSGSSSGAGVSTQGYSGGGSGDGGGRTAQPR